MDNYYNFYWRLTVKNILKVLIITAGMVVFFHVNSFAIVDAAVSGGSVFHGKTEGGAKSKLTSWQYGARAHLNTDAVPLFELGLGGYYEDTHLKFDLLNSSNDKIRKSAGVDANVILSLPLLPINPYVRGTYGFWDRLNGDVEYFNNSWGAGAGIELVVFPLPSIRIFAEYMYDHAVHNKTYINNNSANIGIKIQI